MNKHENYFKDHPDETPEHRLTPEEQKARRNGFLCLLAVVAFGVTFYAFSYWGFFQ